MRILYFVLFSMLFYIIEYPVFVMTCNSYDEIVVIRKNIDPHLLTFYTNGWLHITATLLIAFILGALSVFVTEWLSRHLTIYPKLKDIRRLAAFDKIVGFFIIGSLILLANVSYYAEMSHVNLAKMMPWDAISLPLTCSVFKIIAAGIASLDWNGKTYVESLRMRSLFNMFHLLGSLSLFATIFVQLILVCRFIGLTFH